MAGLHCGFKQTDRVAGDFKVLPASVAGLHCGEQIARTMTPYLGALPATVAGLHCGEIRQQDHVRTAAGPPGRRGRAPVRPSLGRTMR